MGVLTDRLRQSGKDFSAPSDAGLGVGQVSEREQQIADRPQQSMRRYRQSTDIVGEREQAIIDRNKSEFGKGSILQRIAQGKANAEIAARQQQRDYAEQAPPEMAEPVRDMLSNLGNRARVLEVLRQMTPEQREEALRLAPGIAQQLGDDRGGAVGRTLGAISRGISHGVSQPTAELLGMGGTPEEIEYIRQLDAAASQEFSPARPGDPWYEKGPLQAAEMAPWMATVAGGAGLGRAAATGVAGRLAAGAAGGSRAAGAAVKAGQAAGSLPARIGLPALTAGKAGELAGVTLAAFPSQYAQEVDALKEMGIEEGTPGMRLLAGATAALTGLIEGIVPNPFGPAGEVPLTQGALRAARKYLWESAKQAPGEMSEEYLQGVTSGVGEVVADYLYENTEDKTLGDAFKNGWEQAKEAALPMTFLLGVPAVGGAGLSAARARRLSRLQEIRSKGFVSTEDAQQAGIEGKNRKERLANVDAEIKSLETEASRGGDVPPPIPGQQPPALPTEGVTNEVQQGQQAQQPKQGQTQAPTGQVDEEIGVVQTPEEIAKELEARRAQRKAAQSQQPKKSGASDASQVRTDEGRPEGQRDVGQGSQVAGGGQVRVEGQDQGGEEQTGKKPKAPQVPVKTAPVPQQPGGGDPATTTAGQVPPKTEAAKKSPARLNDRVFIPERTQGDKTLPAIVGKVVAGAPGSDSVTVELDGGGKERVKREELLVPDATFEAGEKVRVPWVKGKDDAPATIQKVLPDGKYEVQFASGRVAVQSGDQLIKLQGQQEPESPKWVKYNDNSYGVKISRPDTGSAEATLSYSGEDASLYVDIFAASEGAPKGSGKKLLRSIVDSAAEYKPKSISGHFTNASALGAFGSEFGKENVTFKTRATGKAADITFEEAMKSPGDYVATASLNVAGKKTATESQPEAPEVRSIEDIEVLPKYSVYQVPKTKGRFRVRSEGARGGGDAIFDTYDEAVKYAETERTRDQQRAEAKAKQEERETEEARKEAEYVASFQGFKSDSPMAFGKARKALEVQRNYRGKVLTRKQIVEQAVENGAIVRDGERLERPDGTFLDASAITKTGLAYAEHLIARKSGQSTPSKKKGKKPTAQKTGWQPAPKGGISVVMSPDLKLEESKRQKQSPSFPIDTGSSVTVYRRNDSEMQQGVVEDFAEHMPANLKVRLADGEIVYPLLADVGPPRDADGNIVRPENQAAGKAGFEYGQAVARADDPMFVGRFEGTNDSGDFIVRKDGKRTTWPKAQTVSSDATVDSQGRVIAGQEPEASSDLEAMIEAEFDAQLGTKKPVKKRPIKKQPSTGRPKKTGRKTQEPSATSEPQSKLQKAADKARAEADDLWAELNQQAKDKLTSGLDPDLAKLAVRVALAEIKAGTLSFAAFVEATVAKVPANMLDKMKPYMEMSWKVAHKRGMTDDPGGKFDDVLAKTISEQSDASDFEWRAPEIKGQWIESVLGPKPGSSQQEVVEALAGRAFDIRNQLEQVGHITGAWFDLLRSGDTVRMSHNFTDTAISFSLRDLQRAKSAKDVIGQPGRIEQTIDSLQYGTLEAPNRVELGKHFQQQLESGKSYKSIVEARKEAATLIAGEDASIEPGTPAAKAIDEAVEQGVVRAAREIAESSSDPLEVYDRLLDLYERQPRLNVRTGTSMRQQAYSTPAPAAWVANILSDTSRDNTAYDSSAGNGMLLLGVDPENAITNELNPDRAQALRELGYQVHEGDATEYKPDQQPDRIIINPPFGELDGQRWSVGGITTDKIDHAIVLNTLEALPEDGKAVLIIGSKGFEQRQPKDELRRGEAYKNDKNFYNALYDNYNVTDHFTLHGDLYSKQGAAFPIDMIVIDGRGKSELPKPYQIDRQNAIPRVINNWQELRDVAERYLDTGSGRSSDLSTEPIEGNMGGLSALLEGEGQGTGQEGGRPSTGAGGRGAVPPRGGNKPQQPRGDSGASGVPVAPEEQGSGQPERVSSEDQPSSSTGPARRDDPTTLDREADVGTEDGLQSPYKQRSSARNVGTLVPATHARAVQEALEKAELRYGNLDEFVAKELGYKLQELKQYFSAEQVDALALNIARHKEGKAFVLGDQTGVGKGRVAAATMVYAKRQGLVPVFMTQSPDLFADMYRDLQDIGQHSEGEPFYALATNTLTGKDKIELPDGTTITQTADFAKNTINEVSRNVASGNGPVAMITVAKTTDAKGRPLGKTPKGKDRVRKVKEKREYNAVFSTYSQMQTVKGNIKDRHTAMSIIAPKTFFVLDESHNAGGVGSTDGGHHNDDDGPAGRAARLRHLVSEAQGVLFLSATYAKNPDVMDLYAKTGMDDAVEGAEEGLIETIIRGGIPLQQVLSEMLVESGAYMRREKSFDGINFNASVKEAGREEADEIAGIFGAINALDKIKNDIVSTEGFRRWLTAQGLGLGTDSATGNRGMDSYTFSSIVHNLVDQMLLSIKADAVADEAIASLKRGESPIIALSNTAGAALDNYLNDFPANVGDEIDFGFNSTAYRYLERSREVMLTDKDAQGKKTSRRVRIPDDILGPDGIEAYNAAKALIDEFAANIPASPIDHIRNRITQAGYKVAEITGRSMMVDYSGNQMKLARRPSEEQGKAGKLASVRGYNSGEIDALILNQSGSTGLSAHASKEFINQKRRHMIIAQADKNIDTFMQMLGRINRTGQVEQHAGQEKGSNLPYYTLLMTDVPAEIRPASVLLKKLASLNANVTADAKGSVSFDAPDILNKVGDRVVAEYIADNPDLNHALDDIVEVNADGKPRVMPDIARKVSGRMAMRPVPEQQAFWDAVTETYTEEIAQLDKLGKNPLVATKMDLSARLLERVEIFGGDITADSPFLQPAYADRVRVKKQGEPMSPDEIRKAVNEFYGLPKSSRRRSNTPFLDMESELHREAITGETVSPNVEESNALSESTVRDWSSKQQDRVSDLIDAKAAEQTSRLVNDEAIDRVMHKAGSSKALIRRYLRSVAPGMSVSVAEVQDEGRYSDEVNGIVIDVKAKEGREHLPSGWVATIALSSPDRVLRIPFSRIGDTGNSRPGDVYVAPDFQMADESVYSNWGDAGDVYEERIIGTGNVLAAFDRLVSDNARGNIIFFTNEDGVTQRGVLMPRSFNLDQWAAGRPVTFANPQQVLEFLSISPAHQVNDPNFAIQFIFGGVTGGPGTLLVRSPRSRQRSGKYTTNQELIEASGTDFVSTGQVLQMVVRGRDQQLAVIEAAQKVGPLIAANYKEDATRIAGSPIQRLDNDLDSLAQLESDDIVAEARSQAIDIALDAEDAGIKTYDELVAFSVKKLGEPRTRQIGAYLQAAGMAAGMPGVRPTRDVIGMPGVTREQATTFAKAAFPMLTDEQIESGIELQDLTGFGRDEIGFAPFGTPSPGTLKGRADVLKQTQRDASDNVKGWTQFISATRAIIGATDKADVSTFIHEFFHPMRRFLLDRSIPQEQRAGITDRDIQALENYAGVKDGDWKFRHIKDQGQRLKAVVQAEEKAAKAWEQYWFEGKSPNSALNSLFEKIARWMQGVYRGIQEITGGQLPQEVRDLFDKIVQRGLPADAKMDEPPVEPPIRGSLDQPASNDLTSIKNEVVNELRIRRGMPELDDVAAQTQQEWLDRATGMLAADPGLGDRIVKEINNKARNLSNAEVAVMQIYYRQVNNQLEEASNRLFAADDAGDPVAKARAQAETDLIMEQLAEIEEATKAAGREWGRAGVARQIVLEKDFSLAAILRKARVANAGNPLSAEQQAEMAELARQVAELEGKLAKAEQEKLDLERQLNVERGIEEDKKQVKKTVRKSAARQKATAAVTAFKKKFASIFGSSGSTDTLQQTEEERMAEEAEAVVMAYVELGVYSFGEFMANVRKDLGGEMPVQARVAFATAWENAKSVGEIPTPEIDRDNLSGMTRLARRIQRALVESGITERDEVVDAVHESLQELDPSITRRETMDALSGYGQYTLLADGEIERIIRDINGQLQQLAKLEDMRAGQAPAKTGGERRTPSDEERRLIQEVNEAKRRGGFQVTDPAAQLKTALEAAKTATRNRISDLEHEIKTRERIVRTRTEMTPDQELEDLRKRRDALLEVHKGLFPKPGATMAQRIAAANRAVDKAIADIEEQLRTGDVSPKKGQKEPVVTPELEAKRARLEALREQRDAIRALQNPKMTPEQRAEKAYKANLLKQIADYRDRMIKSDFDPKPKKEPRQLSQEELNLKRQLEEVKQEFFSKAADYRLANMSPEERLWDAAKETAHLSRAAMTSIDLSAVFRQGGIAAFSHPILAKQASKEMLGALFSKQSQFDTAEKIRKHKMYQFAVTAGLSITEEEGKITRQEEAYMGRWAKKVPGIKESARAYTTFLNGIRFSLFNHMVSNLKGGQVTADEAKVVARYVNAATGRADLGKYNKAAANMNMVFFAPRYVASRLQYLGMPFYVLGSRKISGRVKKAILAEYARYAISMGSFLSLTVALGSLLTDDDDEKPTVEIDPRSTDFLKLKIGDTRIDPMSGLSQIIVFPSKVLGGKEKTLGGEFRDLRGPGVEYGKRDTLRVIWDFIRSKMAPVPAAAMTATTVDWSTGIGKDFLGEDIPVVAFPTKPSIVRDLFAPLSLREVGDAIQARGVPAGTAISILALLGMGGGTYGSKTEYQLGNEEDREKQFAKDLRYMEWDSPDPAYSEFLTAEQMERVKQRREERKQDLVYAATAIPDRDDYQSDETFEKAVARRNEAIETLRKAGWTTTEIRQLLLGYWESRYGSARTLKGGLPVLKDAVRERLQQINREFGGN